MLSKEALVLGLNLLSWAIIALNLGSVFGLTPVRSISLNYKLVSLKELENEKFIYSSDALIYI